MSSRSEIFLGDFVRAAGGLEAAPEVWPAIADLLDVSWAHTFAPTRADDGSAEPIGDEIDPHDRDLRRGSADARTARARPRRTVLDDVDLAGDAAVRSTLRPLPGSRGVPPLWRSTAAPLSAPRPEELLRRPPEPLLLPRWTPGVVNLLAATRDATGPVDAVRIVEDLARGHIPPRLPRRERATLSRGAQILLDVGVSLLPYAYDVAGIGRAMARVLGGAPLEILRFAGLPTWGSGPGPRRTWASYRPPARPRPVILISDLGVRRAPEDDEWASPAEWLAFADSLGRIGCPVIALLPYPIERVPAGLARRIALVRWDRTTSVVTVRRILAHASRVEG